MAETDVMKNLADSWKETKDSLHAALTKQQDEIKQFGETTKATADAIRAAEATQKQLVDDMTAKQAELTKRLDDFETKMKRESISDPEMTKSVGTIFSESQQLREMLEAGRLVSAPVKYKKLIHTHAEEVQKATFLLSDQVSRFNAPVRLPLLPLTRRRLRIRDLLPVRRIGTGSIEYLVETGFYDSTAALTVSGIVQTSGTATATTSTAHGLAEGGTVVISGATQTGYNGFKIVTEVPSTTTFKFKVDPATVSPATGTIKAVNNQTNVGAAAGVIEGAQKPEATMAFDIATANVVVIAHWLPVSRQALADTDQLQAYIEDRLLYGLAFREEQQILYGNGTNPNLLGLLANPNRQTRLWSEGVSGDTKIDALRRSMTQVQLAEYESTGIVLHPTDWEDIQLAKADDGHYIYLPVSSAGQGTAEKEFFQVPVVVTSAIAKNQALVGGFAQAATLWDREDAQIRIAEQHSDFFTKNLVAILAEERLALTVYRPQSFVDLSFDSAPA